MNARDAAKLLSVSHTSVYRSKLNQALAEQAGRGDEYDQRIASGEKYKTVALDIFPDAYKAMAFRQAINQFKSTTRKLIREGVDPDLLIEFIEAHRL